MRAYVKRFKTASFPWTNFLIYCPIECPSRRALNWPTLTSQAVSINKCVNFFAAHLFRSQFQFLYPTFYSHIVDDHSNVSLMSLLIFLIIFYYFDVRTFTRVWIIRRGLSQHISYFFIKSPTGHVNKCVTFIIRIDAFCETQQKTWIYVVWHNIFNAFGVALLSFDYSRPPLV
jgi:hypothetical protein